MDEAYELVKRVMFRNAQNLYNLDRTDLYAEKRTTGRAKPTASSGKSSNNTDLKLLEEFEHNNGPLSYVYVQWLDYMATIRARVFPFKSFRALVQSGKGISIALGNSGTLQNDGFTPAINVAGHMYVKPDLHSLKPTHEKDTLRKSLDGKLCTSATVMASFERPPDDQGPCLCPRALLKQQATTAAAKHNINFLVGFEIEFMLLIRGDDGRTYRPFTKNHAWSTMTPEQWERLDVLDSIVTNLASIGIDVEQFHAESGPVSHGIVATLFF